MSLLHVRKEQLLELSRSCQCSLVHHLWSQRGDVVPTDRFQIYKWGFGRMLIIIPCLYFSRDCYLIPTNQSIVIHVLKAQFYLLKEVLNNLLLVYILLVDITIVRNKNILEVSFELSIDVNSWNLIFLAYNKCHMAYGNSMFPLCAFSKSRVKR